MGWKKKISIVGLLLTVAGVSYVEREKVETGIEELKRRAKNA